MATIQEIIAKREELAKTNPNATNIEARNALKSTAPTAPVPPVATNPAISELPVQPTGGATLPISIQEKTPAPPTPTPTPAPVAPAPVGTTTPSGATLTPEGNIVQPGQTAPVDKTPGITQTEFQKAQAESEKIKAQNEAVMAQNKQQADIKAQERKQIAEEQRIASIPTDQKGILNALVGGQTVAEQNTPEYRNALTISNQFKKFNGMTDVDLLNNLKQGQIGTELDGLLSQNPNYAKAKAELAKSQKTASINRATQIASNVISGKTNVIEDDLSGIEAKYNPPLGTNAQAYEAYVVNNPNVVTAGTQLKQLSTQISDVSKTYNDALKSIKSQYGDMPASALLTLMSSRTSDTKELLDSYINAKELAKGDFDMAMKMAEGGYEAYTRDIAVQQQIEAEQRQNQMNRENAVFQADLGLQTKQAEFEQGLAQQAQLASDPISGVQNIVDTFAKMGITADRSTQEMVQEVQSKMAQGMTVGEALSDLQQAFKSKPEYEAMMDAQMRAYAPPAEKAMEYGFSNIGDGRVAIMNPKTGQVSFASAGMVSSANAPTTASARYLDIPDGTDVGVQCGQFARTLCGMDGTPGGNSLEARKQAYTDQTPVAGGMVLFTGSGYDKTYGHIAAIESVNPDGTINLVESNLKNDNRVSRRTIQANDPAIHGFYNNTPLAKQGTQSTGTQDIATQSTGTQYTDSDIELLSTLANMDASARNTALKAQGIPLSAVTDYMAQAKAGKIPPTQAQIQDSLNIMSQIQNISEMDWNDATGMWRPQFEGGDRDTIRGKIDSLVANITLPSLGMLKGPMSDKDLAFIQNASSRLSYTQNDKAFQKEMVELYNIGARKAGLKEITKLSDIPKVRITPGYQPQQSTEQTVGGEIDYTQFVPKK